MTRRAGWEDRLFSTIDDHGRRAFQWGASDCWTMAMDCVKALSGADPWADARRYTTRIGAARVLRNEGFASVTDALSATFTEISAMQADRGDIGVIDTPDGPALVVFEGATVAGKSEVGLIRLPRSAVKRAWKVA